MSKEFSHHLARRGRKPRRRLLIASILVVLLLAIDLMSGGAVRDLARSAAVPVWRLGSNIASVVGGSGFVSSRRALEEENRSLKLELEGLQVRTALYEAMREENEELRSLVGLARSERGITVPIVSSLRASPYGTFLIGAGEASGVSAHDLVLLSDGEGGFVVGEVADVSAKHALVKELFAGGAELEATVRGVSLVLEGRGGGNARAEVPHGSDIREGDVLIAHSYGGRPVGVVGAREEDDALVYDTLFIRTPTSLFDTPYVYIVLSE